MLVKNLSTGKTHEVTEENYNQFLKGKENWDVMPEPKTQVVTNTGNKGADLSEKDDKNSKHKTNKKS